ncbi:hypothetical protein [Klenkia taihuensis]|uniref:hypothetical protein n=1 Tax=Klenkia taihuensis TaxID=1225127 RepID=UPI0010423897|nr:hypothetical protein [Klenkia taihuensis]GHE07015.1 hypothetical protein GCM10011381_01410 [Klenkia taihuensis]
MDSFEEAGSQLRNLANAFYELVMKDYGPPWAASSRVLREVQENPYYRGRWGTRPVQDATMSAHAALVLAHDHLVGMAHLFSAKHTLTTPVTLARTVMVAAARAYWQFDPGITVRERVRRAMNVQLASYQERDNLLGPAQSQARDKLVSQVLAITQTAARHGFTVMTDRPRYGQLAPLRFLDAKLPHEMKMVHEMLADDESDELGRTVYRVASAVVHAQPHTLGLLNFQRNGRPVDGVGAAEMSVSLQALTTYTGGAVLGVYNSAGRALDHAGLATRAWERAALPVLRKWGETMNRLPHA